jgi:hypothetical protein
VDAASTSVLNAVNTWGEIGPRRNDNGSLLRSYNTSAGSPLQFYLDHSLGDVNIGNSRGIVNCGGTYWVIANSVRSPIFYDSNNTAYYADFASTGDSIRAAGNITAYYSDMRLKTHLGKIENALEKVNKLEGFYYEANEVAQKLGYKPKREVGVSAQDVQEVLPEIVADAPINSNYLTIDYERLTPLLIEAIKEQNKEVVDLRARVAMLESLISKLIDV